MDATVLLLTEMGVQFSIWFTETQGAEEASLYCWMVVGVLSSYIVPLTQWWGVYIISVGDEESFNSPLRYC